jgi:hypothetical protein
MKCNYKQQLKIGKKIEMEHAHLFPKKLQKTITLKIAKDHLKENKCYYSLLTKLEGGKGNTKK